ncbi:MAG: ABC transporter permease subunit [Halofilum sp. (in: g-proteobacteria)]|nr:ABC transporter permease subunit [Halofilum sp. (in: g-proteobacteria)]
MIRRASRRGASGAYSRSPCWAPSGSSRPTTTGPARSSGRRRRPWWSASSPRPLRATATSRSGRTSATASSAWSSACSSAHCVGIPLGFAMGLLDRAARHARSIVEFMRPIPPLALIPLMVIWFGIGETAKIMLLFLGALWIMTLAARAGVFSVSIPKVHAAYSLRATRAQLLRHVILPNALPEIFTGLRTVDGCVLDHGGGRRAGRRPEGAWLDDHGRVEVHVLGSGRGRYRAHRRSSAS